MLLESTEDPASLENVFDVTSYDDVVAEISR